MKQTIIAPSILSSDLARLGEEVEAVLKAGGDWIHFDVMGNHYVPNLSFGPSVCQALRNFGIKAAIDVHLMVKPVDNLIQAFAKAGASYISIHPEASLHLDRSLSLIRECNCKVGLAFNPATPLEILPYVIDKIDLILIMSVNPGFAGQSFIPGTLAKIQEAREWIDKSKKEIRLEVDGGINPETIGKAYKAGADVFVAGSAIFGSDNYQDAIQALKTAMLS